MPDVFRQAPGSILGVLLLFLSFAAPAPVSGQPKANEAESKTGAPLALTEALAQALLHNPELTVHSEEILAREAEELQSGFLPNPVLSIEAENVFGSGDFSGADAAETTVSLSQSIELGDKRARRRELAGAETAVAGNDYALAKVDVLAKTEEGFIAVLAAQERLKLAEELATLAEKVLVTVEERIAAGKAPTTESVKARIQLRELEVVREKARRDLTAARISLASRMGLETADFGPAFGKLSRLPALPAGRLLRGRLFQRGRHPSGCGRPGRP
jgi:cobalt-zinc-cadmium efflux system outer membrane protein